MSIVTLMRKWIFILISFTLMMSQNFQDNVSTAPCSVSTSVKLIICPKLCFNWKLLTEDFLNITHQLLMIRLGSFWPITIFSLWVEFAHWWCLKPSKIMFQLLLVPFQLQSNFFYAHYVSTAKLFTEELPNSTYQLLTIRSFQWMINWKTDFHWSPIIITTDDEVFNNNNILFTRLRMWKDYLAGFQ